MAALRQILIGKKLDAARSALDAHKGSTAIADKRTALTERQERAQRALEELTATSTQEERDAVEAEVDACDAEQTAIDAEQSTYDTELQRLQGEVDKIEHELKEASERASAATEAATKHQVEPAKEEREEYIPMNKRSIFGLDAQQRDAFIARSDVKDFLGSVRSVCKNRSVSGVPLTIPEVMLDLMRDSIERYSKLLPYVRVKQVKGEARQNIMGVVPEGVWTEVTGSMNELDMTLNQVTVDGYLVGGFLAISNSYIEDSDLALASEILDALGQAIGKALDRAILFGTGTKMPIGIATRLAQTSQPASWGANAPAWTDLHSSHVKTSNYNSSNGVSFFASLIADLSVASPDYTDGKAVWIMNRKTALAIRAKALEFDSSATLVSNVTQMPVIGGDIVEEEFLHDNEIIGGYAGAYLLAEREGAKLALSDQVKFLDNQTVFRGLARYDGMPVIGEAFVIVRFDNTSAATSSTFETDWANTALGLLGVTAAAGAASGDTVLTVTGSEASGTTLKYKIGNVAVKAGGAATGFTALTSGTTQITCAAGKPITVVELDANSKIVKAGVATAVPKA